MKPTPRTRLDDLFPVEEMWTVELIGLFWYILHPTKRGRRIGPMRSHGINYYDRAVAEALRRNHLEDERMDAVNSYIHRGMDKR